MSGIVGVSSNMKSGVTGRAGSAAILQVVSHQVIDNFNGNENSWQTAFTRTIDPKSDYSKIHITLQVAVHWNLNNSSGASWSIQESNVKVGTGATFGDRIETYTGGNIFWATCAINGEAWVDNNSLAQRTFQAKWINAKSNNTAVAHEKGHFLADSTSHPAVFTMTEYGRI